MRTVGPTLLPAIRNGRNALNNRLSRIFLGHDQVYSVIRTLDSRQCGGARGSGVGHGKSPVLGLFACRLRVVGFTQG